MNKFPGCDEQNHLQSQPITIAIKGIFTFQAPGSSISEPPRNQPGYICVMYALSIEIILCIYKFKLMDIIVIIIHTCVCYCMFAKEQRGIMRNNKNCIYHAQIMCGPSSAWRTHGRTHRFLHDPNAPIAQRVAELDVAAVETSGSYASITI